MTSIVYTTETPAPVVTEAEIVEPAPGITAEEARKLTDRIFGHTEDLCGLIAEAYDRRVWEVLDYPSWAAYCAAEFGYIKVPRAERGAVVEFLRASGMSNRAIGSAIGVNEITVRRESPATNVAPPPETVEAEVVEVHQRRRQCLTCHNLTARDEMVWLPGPSACTSGLVCRHCAARIGIPEDLPSSLAETLIEVRTATLLACEQATPADRAVTRRLISEFAAEAVEALDAGLAEKDRER